MPLSAPRQRRLLGRRGRRARSAGRARGRATAGGAVGEAGFLDDRVPGAAGLAAPGPFGAGGAAGGADEAARLAGSSHRRDRAGGAAVDELVEVGVGRRRPWRRSGPASGRRRRAASRRGRRRCGRCVMSWVMVTAVAPISVTSSRIRSLMTPAMIGSRPGGRLVEEDDRRVGGDGAGEADALLHAAGELGRVEVGGLGAEADAARACRWRARGRPRADSGLRAWRRRKATFCQTVRLSKSAPPWNSMPKCAQEARAGRCAANGMPSIRTCAGVGRRGCRGCTSASPTCRCRSRR